VLHKATTTTDTHIVTNFYYAQMIGGETTLEYQQCDFQVCRPCRDGGRVLVTVSVLTWLILNLMIMMRVLALLQKYPTCLNTLNQSRIEIVFSLVATFSSILMNIVWGATCYHETRVHYSSITPSGYMFVILCAILAMPITCVSITFIHSAQLTSVVPSSSSPPPSSSEVASAATML
jgi:hypothetical protein